jgi:site-specific DNA-methyltransferase (adenine-specific)/adenine-specific DNA-methyltransferase
MPTLDWIGKKAVLNHHQTVPYRLLRCDTKLSAGDLNSGNLLVEGDNLEALKALLPYYAGKVRCIYIDPPYNTGNEDWIYNDAVNSPEMRSWLGRAVGKEAEDLSRHDKWLCMMYPRLRLLRDFLREDGVLFVSIGNDESGHLRLLLDEIFGARNFITSIAWQTAYTANQTARHISDTHDTILLYARSAERAQFNKFERSEDQVKQFKNPDADPRGPWKAENLSAGKFYAAGQFTIVGPTGKKFTPPSGRFWRCNEAQYETWLRDGRITFGRKNTGRPMLKKYLSELQEGLTPTTWWPHQDFGSTKEASLELKKLFGGRAAFPTPKPVKLVRRILQLATGPKDLVLDSFAGSGTTGHAVMLQNESDGGSRRFILIEMDAAIAKPVTAARLKMISERSNVAEIPSSGEDAETAALIKNPGFRYCTLGASLFDGRAQISESVRFEELARHVFFSETGLPSASGSIAGQSPLIGTANGVAYFLLYNGILGDKRPDGGNILTSKVLSSLPPHDGPRVVFGEGCRLGMARLKSEGVTFKQIPYQIKT